MEFNNGYIINPADFRVGMLYMSPFSSDDVFFNRQVWLSSSIKTEPLVYHNGRQHAITHSATGALDLVLADLKLNKNDEVWIVTTSGNRYISGCVTRTIEKHCSWSRERNNNTAAILVNHEFGFASDIAVLKATGLPLIEDCAFSMYSEINGDRVGKQGDYAIFSMAKMFPMQSGGLVYSAKGCLFDDSLTSDEIRYLKACYNYYRSAEEDIILKRRSNYEELKRAFTSIGLKTRFELRDGDVPGAFLFRASGIDLPALKVFLQQQGVECSVFYGEDSFFIPCHQKMNDYHINYLQTLVSIFLK